MKRSPLLSLVTILLLLLSCKKDTTEPGPEPNGPFEFRVLLSDASGNPKPGIEIQAWNRIPCWAAPNETDCVMRGSPGGRVESFRAGVASKRPQGNPASIATSIGRLRGAPDIAAGSESDGPAGDRLGQNYPNPFTSATAVSYDVASPSPYALNVYNGSGVPIRTLATGRQAGHYEVRWDGRDDGGREPVGGSGIYEIRFTVWSPDSSRIVYQDTVFAARYQPHERPLGYTDQQGVFVSTDKALFPSVGDDRLFHAVNQDGFELGPFAFDDTLVITAVDTAAGEAREYKRVLSGSANRFELVWR
jgi:hypothetical protein